MSSLNETSEVKNQLESLEEGEASDEATPEFVSKIVVHLHSGYDMPIDQARSHDLMPSVYCEVGYSKYQNGYQNQLNAQTSSTKVCSRNPIWNEQIPLAFML